MKKILFFLFLFFIQNSFTQIQVKAKLVNAETLKLIEFASVLNLETLEGTISDTLGHFTLNAKTQDSKLMIQSLGYVSDTFTVKEINDIGILKLMVNDFRINDVIVYPKSAFDIVRKAVLKIDSNYNAETMAQNVFSREELIANDQLLGIREANFNALAKFKNEENANLISVNKARYFKDIDILKNMGKMVTKQLGSFDTTDIRNNAEQFFRMNVLLSKSLVESKTDLLGEKSMKYYKYNYNGLVKKDDFVAYHITFDQIDGIKKSLFKGHFYIDTATLGFIDIQIYASPKGVEYQKYIPKTVKFALKLFGFTIYIKGMDYHLHYKLMNEKWVLDKAFTKLSAVVSKKGFSYDGFMRVWFDVNKFYPKEEFYNRKSNYDKIESDIEPFNDKDFFKSLHYIPNKSSSNYLK
jgi:hypothetical protein